MTSPARRAIAAISSPRANSASLGGTASSRWKKLSRAGYPSLGPRKSCFSPMALPTKISRWAATSWNRRKEKNSKCAGSPRFKESAMPIFAGELGLQFVTHLANHYTVPELVRLARFAADKGFKHIWVNDNIRYRSQVVVLTAIASHVPIHLGTAIMVPYFHNPLDVADSLGALSELCEGQQISVGIARGDLGQSPQHVEPLKPIAMVSETTRFLRRALAGDEIAYSDYPFLQDFYRLNRRGRFRLAFKPRAAFKFYGGGNGPQSLRMCGRVMDGLISSGTYIPMLKAGRLPEMLATADQAAKG